MTIDLDDLERLAREASENPSSFLRQLTTEEIAFTRRASPDVVLALIARVREAERERDCRQEGACALSPGCQRHWQERNAELVRERDEARRLHSEAEAQIACRNELRYRAESAEARVRELEMTVRVLREFGPPDLRAIADAAEAYLAADGSFGLYDATRMVAAREALRTALAASKGGG